jgi:hypothetical protein
MSYLEHWRALAARIRSVTDAGQLYAQFQISHSADSYNSITFLGQQCQRILAAIETFAHCYSHTLPPEASNALKMFLEGNPAKVIKDKDGMREGRAALIFLAAIESEISYLLADQQEYVRARSERAFMHLQRLLVVDTDTRSKWRSAFDQRETECEKLGAVHLLWHGILAFKVDASGARTDLIFSEPIEQSEQRGVEGLVLTEWKVAKDPEDAQERFDEAGIQARLYAQGPLVGNELTAYRYLVVVSLRNLEAVPDDRNEGGVIYRHINIAIEPQLPSTQARKTAPKRKVRE